ncbi:MAG: GNAT family N-acetyltransferase [Pseudomonadota bacterium]
MNLPIPTLTTDRLILRAPVEADFDALAAFYETDRSVWHGGPLPRYRAWSAFAANLGHWVLRGFGLWTLEHRSTGAVAGRCGIWSPEGWREPEIAWTAYDGFEGRGLIFEAAQAVRDAAFGSFGLASIASPIHPDNARSIALAKRLGATEDGTWTLPHGTPGVLYRFHPS